MCKGGARHANEALMKPRPKGNLDIVIALTARLCRSFMLSPCLVPPASVEVGNAGHVEIKWCQNEHRSEEGIDGPCVERPPVWRDKRVTDSAI